MTELPTKEALEQLINNRGRKTVVSLLDEADFTNLDALRDAVAAGHHAWLLFFLITQTPYLINE